jgi:putative CocE/NonD family hydrolase
MTRFLSSDAPWWGNEENGGGPVKRYGGFKRSSQYLTMQDGTKIAIYLYLPEGLAEDDKIPCILFMTPYISMIEYRHPLFEKLVRLIAHRAPSDQAEEFAFYGYATVLMDLRGSGASYGQKRSIFMDDLQKDAPEVVEWITSQPWSNGNVGATGVSAVGMTSQWLLTAKHPAVKAIAPRFSVFDIYLGVHEGGLTPNRFLLDIGKLLRSMDQNRLHEGQDSIFKQWLMRILIKGIQPIDEDINGVMLSEVVEDHASNKYFDQDISVVEFRDDPLPNSSIPATLDTQSPFSHITDMEASGASIYSFTGWYDGAFSREMINLHMNVRTKGSKLIIGPWGHGGGFYCSPLIYGKRKTDFDQIAELVRFFDYHLKGIDSRIASEPAIHYFTLGEEMWKSADTWPPPGSQSIRYFLSANHTLNTKVPSASGAFDVYRVDFEVGTGVHSRFGKHLSGGMTPVKYPGRKHRDKKLLCYTSATLDREVEITGHPEVKLFINSSSLDGAFIVYLEDIDPHGNVFNVTDGMLRARHRKTSSSQPPYRQFGVYHTFNRADEMSLVPGKMAELSFELMPVSYLFKAGHCMRIAIAGADKDNFAPVSADSPPEIKIYRSASHASYIDLPIIKR